MMRSLFSAVSGLRNHQTAMDVIGNNISNVNTIGYKSNMTIFSDIYSQTVSSATGATATTGGSNAKQIGLGMTISGIRTNITEGSNMSTGGDLDFKITGEGYFMIKASDGNTYYTRNGAFELDNKGNLVTQSGNLVQGVMIDEGDIGNPTVPTPTGFDPATDTPTTIKIDPNLFKDYSIDSNGVITAVVKAKSYIDTSVTPNVTHSINAAADVGDKVVIGRITLSSFVNAPGLEKVGDSLYTVSANSGDPMVNYANEDVGKLEAGSLEMSNVDLANELTNMIIMQRGFQANSRVITTSDSMLEELVNLKR